MAKKNLNSRCPLQAECERKCEYEGHELDCEYYANNGVGEDRTIPDQEEKRRDIERHREEDDFLADLGDDDEDGGVEKNCSCKGCENPDCVCAGGVDAEARAICDGLHNCAQGGCTYALKHRQEQTADHIADVGKMVYLPIEKLSAHPDNPRKELGDLAELADSIKANGVLQNLTVVPRLGEITGQPTGTYTVVIGHRRLAASKLAGLKELPCVISDMTLRDQVRTMLMENIQRADLTVYEQAQGFQMMLDMGDSVDDIARKSGFSQTTVRRRVKLLELDQEKFRASVERGANLMDYMELDKINDPELKNEVLDAIGTNNFKMKLAGAVEKEKSRAIIAERAQALSAFATEVKDVDYSTMRYVRNYGTWNKKDTVERPDDADSVAYYYRIGNSQVDLYRQNIEEPKDQEAEAKKERFKAEQDRRHTELVTLSTAAYKARLNFIKDFSAAKKHSATVCRFASGVFLRGQDGADDEIMENLLGVGIDAENGEIDTTAFDEKAKEHPEYALLVTAYALFDAEGQTYFWWHWDTKHQCSTSAFQENADLDFLYEILVELGYEMSDDEKALQNGTHELFEEVADE